MVWKLTQTWNHPFLLQWWLDVWTNYMIQDYWIHVPNHQWLFTFPTLLMIHWKKHIYIYIYNACYIVFLWLKWLGISSPSEINTIINTVLRNWSLWNLVYLVFWKCLRFNDDDGLRHWVYYIIHYWICHDLPQSSPWFGIPIINPLPESCWWVTSTSRNKSPNVEYCSSSQVDIYIYMPRGTSVIYHGNAGMHRIDATRHFLHARLKIPSTTIVWHQLPSLEMAVFVGLALAVAWIDVVMSWSHKQVDIPSANICWQKLPTLKRAAVVNAAGLDRQRWMEKNCSWALALAHCKAIRFKCEADGMIFSCSDLRSNFKEPSGLKAFPKIFDHSHLTYIHARMGYVRKNHSRTKIFSG